MKIRNWFLALAVLCLVPLAMAMAMDSYSSKDEYNSIVVSFAEGGHKLSAEHVKMLRKIVQKSQSKGNISKVEIAAWSDNEHRSTGNLSKADRNLADRRLQTIKKALRKDIGKLNYISMYNMAENAHWLARVFNTSEADLDAVFAKKEPDSLDRQDFTIIKRDGAPSKAVVILKVHRK